MIDLIAQSNPPALTEASSFSNPNPLPLITNSEPLAPTSV